MRTMTAFYVAPLAAPLILGVYFENADPQTGSIITPISLAVSYAGTFLFGVPIYLFLRARKLTAFWIAPLVGFIVGATTWCATFALFGLSLKFAHALEGGGLLGAVVGTILWLIARPDRKVQANA
jgi:hypothetical protein